MVGISMGAALLGSAVIGAGASAIGASKNSKAIKQSTAAQQQGNTQAIAAQQQARQENLALQSPIYNAGLPAMGARNALLGLGGQAQSLPTAQPMQAQPFNALGGFGGGPQAVSGKWGGGFGMEVPGGYAPQQGYAQQTQQAQPGQTSQQAAGNAFDMFRNSTGYQFRLGEGMDALNSGWAGAGTLQSGAAMKAAQEYGQNYASAEFGNYMGYLGEQQNLASGAANAMSGVNTTYANNAGNLAIANGQNLSNAAVAKANNSNALIGTIGAGVGNVLGGMSYGGFGGGGGGTYVQPTGTMPMSGAYARAF